MAFDAIDAAASRGLDTVLVDTAGRLHTQEGLMHELRKVVRVIGRRLPGAPHETLLVLDATAGQNALRQARLFKEAADVLLLCHKQRSNGIEHSYGLWYDAVSTQFLSGPDQVRRPLMPQRDLLRSGEVA